jgi:UDP-glucose:(glucosyl)LPS alpha-1,2-glucosyltransferase
MEWNANSGTSSGGTELIGRRIEERLPAALLDRFQIMLSKPSAPDPDRIPVLWCHLQPSDLEAAFLADGGWRRFARIVFVSNWQAQRFIARYEIPWSRCQVIPNAVVPFPEAGRRAGPLDPAEPVRLVYTSVPDRGLVPLLHAFSFVAQVRDDVELDVFSAYRLYGWEQVDEHLRPLYDSLREHPRIRYHGAVPNDEVRGALRRAHVHAHPAIVPETSCLALIEAMSAGLACVHPNLGALYETAAGQTLMYPYHEDLTHHVQTFIERLLAAIHALRTGDPGLRRALTAQKQFADRFYDVDRRASDWESMLTAVAAAVTPGRAR